MKLVVVSRKASVLFSVFLSALALVGRYVSSNIWVFESSRPEWRMRLSDGAPPRNMTNTFPRLIHVTWKDTHISISQARHLKSWVQKNPGWKVIFWTDKSNRDLISSNYSWFLPVFDGFSENIKRADAIRYFILYTYGGLYVDLDFESLRPIEGYLQTHSAGVILGEEPHEHSRVLYRMPRLVCNALMVSKPQHPFWLRVFKAMMENASKNVMESTGPKMLEKTLQVWQASEEGLKYPVYVARPEVFYPTYDVSLQRERVKTICQGTLSQSQRNLTRSICTDLKRRFYRNKRISRQSYAMHTWSHTWIYKSKDAERTIDALVFLHDMMHGKVSLESRQYGFRNRHQRWQPKIVHRRHTKKYIRARQDTSPLVGIGKECDFDRLAYCKTVVPGLGRTRRCLVEHASELTAACCKWLANSKQGNLRACSKK